VRLDYPFYKFPFRFDADRLRRELETFPEEAWHWHHENFKGNSALHLVTTNGTLNEDFDAPMLPTEHLMKMPYVRQVFSQFRTLLGRARMLRLEPEKGVPVHIDNNYYWRTHTRVHIPIITDQRIRFRTGDQEVHMAAGEAWTFNNWLPHTVINETEVRRVHLTFDTYGSSTFWALARPLGNQLPEQFIPYQEGADPKLAYETFVGPSVMSPSELELEILRHMADLAAHPQNDRSAVAALNNLLLGFLAEWRIAWHEYGPSPEGIERFQVLRESVMVQAGRFLQVPLLLASNNGPVAPVLHDLFIALMKAALPGSPEEIVAAGPKFERPIFIVAAPRSGSTLLFETLSAAGDLWTLGGEGHEHIESIPVLQVQHHGMSSNRLTDESATGHVQNRVIANYIRDLRNAGGEKWNTLSTKPGAVRFLEKTPKNALRIPFFKKLFPDAKFIFLHRDPRANISAIMDAWRSGGFVTYPRLPDWNGAPWSLLLIPGWRELNGIDPAKIAMHQWRDTNRIILDDLKAMPREDWCAVSYEQLLSNPQQVLQKLCAFAGIKYDERLRAVAEKPLKPSRYTISAPAPEKWKRNEAAMKPFLPETEDVVREIAQIPEISDVKAAQ
jgi:hypothetical protein